MTFILISGDQNSGKTSVCKKLRDMIELNANFAKPGKPSNNGMTVEVLEHYEKDGKHIVLNSPSDDNGRIGRLAKYIDEFRAALDDEKARPDILITTIREEGVPMNRMLALLEAIANNEPNLLNYFNQNIANVTSFDAPTSIKHHAFVLHLEKDDSKDAAALARYWDDSADKVKYMLDFAIARL